MVPDTTTHFSIVDLGARHEDGYLIWYPDVDSYNKNIVWKAPYHELDVNLEHTIRMYWAFYPPTRDWRAVGVKYEGRDCRETLKKIFERDVLENVPYISSSESSSESSSASLTL